MRKIQAIFMATVFGLTTQAFAQDDEGEAVVDDINEPVEEAVEEVQTDMNMETSSTDAVGYGSAGCGLGSLLFEPSNGFTQVFAATTNTTFGTQTFGITSGTSNCDAAGYSGGTAAFIETNRAALAKDISRGKGATISGLTDLAGCSDAQVVGQALQKNFTAIFPDASTSDQEVSGSVIRVLKSESSLSCNNLS